MALSHRRLSVLTLLIVLVSLAPAARPALAASFVVTKAADTNDGVCDADCSLREAIAAANTSGGADTITFAIPATAANGYNSAGFWRLALASNLPALSGGATTIQGPGASDAPATSWPHPRIVLDGAALSSGNGLTITSASNVISRLTIVNFHDNLPLPSRGIGVVIDGAGATDNRVEGSYIGVDPANTTGTSGNSVGGVVIRNGASRNTVGGTSPAARNVIAGNGWTSTGFLANVYLGEGTGPLVSANIVQGNYIGTNASGTTQVTGGNLSAGIWAGDGASDTQVLGNLIAGIATSPSQRTVPQAAIRVEGGDASRYPTNTQIRGNILGLPAGGQAPGVPGLYNSYGVYVQRAVGTVIGGATTTPGGTDPAARNVISGSGATPSGTAYAESIQQNMAAVYVTASDTTGTIVQGNYIGLDVDGDPLGAPSGATPGNKWQGVNLTNNSTGTIVRSNVISNNGSDGVRLSSGGNTVQNNYIGTNVAGAASSDTLTNYDIGIRVNRGNSNQILANTVAAGTLTLAAVQLRPFSAANVSATTVQGNFLGVNSAGAALATVWDSSTGVLVEEESSSGVVTGATIAGNTIGGVEYGVRIKDTPSAGHVVRANTIGPTSGPSGVPNVSAGFGIWLENATGNTIGGPAPADGNTVFGAATYGIYLDGSGDNDVQNNIVRDNGGDGVRVRAATGVLIDHTATRGNAGAGIALAEGGNANMPAPTFGAGAFTSAPALTAGIPAGACGAGGCTIQVFTSPTSDPGEGPRFLTEATVAADLTSVTVPVPACDRFLTATLRDNVTGNTSPFSAEVDTGAGCAAATITLSGGVRVPPGFTGAGDVPPGATVVYEYTVTNSGGLPATVTVARSGGTFPAAGPTPDTFTLSGGASQTFRVTVSVPADAPGGAADSFTVTVTGGPTPQSVTTTTRVAQAFGVEIAPEPPQDRTFGAGGVTLSFTHLITNTGNGPDSFTVTAVATPTLSGITVTQLASCADLAAGASCRVRVDVPIPAAAAPSYDITVTATSQGDASVSDTAVNRAIGAAAAPGLTPQGQAKDALPGETVVFTRTLTNVGTEAGDFTLALDTAALPAGWSAMLDPSGPLTLAPSESATITTTITLAPLSATTPLSGTLVSAPITASSDDGIVASGTDTVLVRLLPRFELSAAPPQTAAPGATVVFTHTLQNTSNGRDTYTLLITPTAGLESVTVTPTITLERGASAEVVVQARVRDFQAPGAESIELSAQTVSSPKPSPAVRTDVVNVPSVAGISLSPAQTRPVASVPAVVTFTHVLTNVGNVSGDFAVTPTLLGAPAGWTIDAVTEDPDGCLTGLASGATCAFTVTVTVPADPLPLSRDYALRVDVTTSGASASVTDTVAVGPIAGIAFGPDQVGSTAPDTPIEYTHTLTNTGNITATFTLSVDSSPAGWPAPQIIPALLPDVGPGITQTARVIVTPPANAPAGGPFDVVVRARSSVAPGPQATVTDSTSVLDAPAARLTPPEQTKAVFPTPTQSDTVSFGLALANSGNTVISYTLGLVPLASGPAWTALITPTATAALPADVSVTLPVTVTVTAPAGASGAQAFRVEARRGASGEVLATATVTATVAAPVTDMLTPAENEGLALPGETVVYTHTLKNVRGVADTFRLSTVAPFGWETVLAPSSVFLPAGGTTTVAVGIRVPTNVLSGTVDVTTLTATSASDPAVTASARERTTVTRVTAAALSPRFVQIVEPGQTVELRHTLVNIGNALDTFTIQATDTLGWPLVVLSPSTQLAPAGFDNYIRVQVTVPANVPLGAVNRVTVTATSRSGAVIVSGVENVLALPAPPEPAVERSLFLPVMMR